MLSPTRVSNVEVRILASLAEAWSETKVLKERKAREHREISSQQSDSCACRLVDARLKRASSLV